MRLRRFLAAPPPGRTSACLPKHSAGPPVFFLSPARPGRPANRPGRGRDRALLSSSCCPRFGLRVPRRRRAGPAPRQRSILPFLIADSATAERSLPAFVPAPGAARRARNGTNALLVSPSLGRSPTASDWGPESDWSCPSLERVEMPNTHNANSIRDTGAPGKQKLRLTPICYSKPELLPGSAATRPGRAIGRPGAGVSSTRRSTGS